MLNGKWEDEYEKLEKLCESNDLKFSIKKSTFPIRFIIEPMLTNADPSQLTLDGADSDVEEKNEISMEFVFAEELIVKFIGDFVIDDETLSKLKNQAKKLHYIHLQMWFRDKEARWNRYRYPRCFRDHAAAKAPDSNGYVYVYVPHGYRP